MSVGRGCVLMSCSVDVGIGMRGEKLVPRRSPGSMSVDPEGGIVWYLFATNISVSEESPWRGSMSTRWRPARANTPEEQTKLTGTRDGVDERDIARTPANSTWKVWVVGRLSLLNVERPSVRVTKRESPLKIGWEG